MNRSEAISLLSENRLLWRIAEGIALGYPFIALLLHGDERHDDLAIGSYIAGGSPVE